MSRRTSAASWKWRCARHVQNDEMHLNYQPVVDAATGALTGFEALLRWSHPQLGNISPMKFIPPCRGSPADRPDRRMGAAHRLRRRRRAGARRCASRSTSRPTSSTTSGFVSTVASALANSGLPPERLELEVTESVFMREGTGATKVLERIMDLGVRPQPRRFRDGLFLARLSQPHPLLLDQDRPQLRPERVAERTRGNRHHPRGRRACTEPGHGDHRRGRRDRAGVPHGAGTSAAPRSRAIISAVRYRSRKPARSRNRDWGDAVAA